MLTTQEVEQYMRLTLKQWGMSSVRVQWMQSNRFLGLAYAEDGMIELSENVLASFGLFREVFLHELAHLLDFQERGTYVVASRRSLHGKNWRKWCAILQIPARLRIPV